MEQQITIVFSFHSIETLPILEKIMRQSDLIILEEAPNLSFEKMLKGEISIEDYLIEEMFDFPNFSFRFFQILQSLFKEGKKILQIEPYMERLLKIYKIFSDGKTPKDVELNPELNEVYAIEKKASKALIDFYEISINSSFQEVVEAVKVFTKADAERFRFRDILRAEAVLKSLPDKGRVFIEAGAIHQYFKKYLYEKLKKLNISTVFTLEEIVKNITGKRWIFPPGDLLVLRYIYGAKENEELENILSARALIYITIIEKEEMIPTEENKFPHILDEIKAVQLVNRLDFQDCDKLYRHIRFTNRKKALNIVKKYFSEKYSYPSF